MDNMWLQIVGGIIKFHRTVEMLCTTMSEVWLWFCTGKSRHSTPVARRTAWASSASSCQCCVCCVGHRSLGLAGGVAGTVWCFDGGSGKW